MSQPTPDKAQQRTSENAAADAASPSPPMSQRPASPKIQPLEAQLIPVTHVKLYRPPPAGAAGSSHVAPAAPAPRLRPSAPWAGPGPNPPAMSSADQIAGMLSSGETSQPAEPGFDYSALKSTAPLAKKTRAGEDPEYFRKTIIPILLTFGVVLGGWGALILFSGEDNAMGDLFPRWTPVALFIVAGIFLVLGVLNALDVKRRESRGEIRNSKFE